MGKIVALKKKKKKDILINFVNEYCFLRKFLSKMPSVGPVIESAALLRSMGCNTYLLAANTVYIFLFTKSCLHFFIA